MIVIVIQFLFVFGIIIIIKTRRTGRSGKCASRIAIVIWLINTIIHFIETRLENTIITIIKIQMAWLTGLQVIW